MKKIKIVTIVGTRPEIIRLSSVINQLNSINSINHINFIPVNAKHGFAKFVDKISNNAKNKSEIVRLINYLMFSKKKNYKKLKKIN